MFINDKKAGEGEVPRLIPYAFGLGSGLTCGFTTGSTVSEAYKAPFRFGGTLKSVVVDLK